MRPRLLSLFCCVALCIGVAHSAERAAAPTDAEIRRILVERIDTQEQSVGIVVGVVDANGRRVVSYGSMGKEDPRPVNGDTVYEIGSITKVFTALLTSDMARKGELKLDDPVSRHLGESVKVPERGRQITLTDLATHTSGLPRMPSNFRPKDPANPYVDYSEKQLFDFIASHELIRDVGSKFEYSNLAFGLLGQALARRAGMGYEELIKARIVAPLGMSSTGIAVTSDMERRFAIGHTADLVPVSRWDIPTLAGAGALRSTADDLLTFLSAVMGYVESPLHPAMRNMLSVKRPTGQPFVDVALAWMIDTRGGGEIIWMNGGTGGYRTFIGYSPGSGVGIVALSNASTTVGVDDIGLHLLDARFPLAIPSGSPKAASIAPAKLDQYVGRYQLAPNFILNITREGDQLYSQATGQSRAAIYSRSEQEFFFKVVDAQITFQSDREGRVTGLVLHQNGRDQPAGRIDEAEAQRLEDVVAKRLQEQSPQPGSEVTTRRLVAELQAGRVDYNQLADQFAAIARENEARSIALVASLGALQTVTFKGVAPGGLDRYELQFENGRLDWRILLAPDGKVAGAGMGKLP